MLKLINYKCTKCDRDIEYFVDENEEVLVGKCPECGSELIKFNFKHNSSRVYIQDQMK